MTATFVSKLPQNPKPIRIEPDLLDALARELRAYTGPTLAKAQRAVQAVLASGFQGTWDQLLARFAAAVKDAVGKRYRAPTLARVTDGDRAKIPPRGGPLRMMPEIASALEDLLAPFDGAELERKQAAVLAVFRSGVSGSFAEIVATYKAAIEVA